MLLRLLPSLIYSMFLNHTSSSLPSSPPLPVMSSCLHLLWFSSPPPPLSPTPLSSSSFASHLHPMLYSPLPLFFPSLLPLCFLVPLLSVLRLYYLSSSFYLSTIHHLFTAQSFHHDGVIKYLCGRLNELEILWQSESNILRFPPDEKKNVLEAETPSGASAGSNSAGVGQLSNTRLRSIEAVCRSN